MQKTLYVKKVLSGNTIQLNKEIKIKDGVIISITDISTNSRFDFECLAPSLVDLHINGGENFHFTANPTIETIQDIDISANKNGVGYTLPTIITAPKETIFQAIDSVNSYQEKNPNTGVIGMHLEGPFISLTKRGAHLVEYIQKPSDSFISEIITKSGDTIAMITIAPEEFSNEQITQLVNSKMLVSLGHSNATFSKSTEAFNLGVNSVTHLFNAMSAFNHREAGLVGASLGNTSVFTPIILDNVHVSNDAAKIAFKLKKDKLYLISDALFQNYKKQTFQWGGFDAYLKGNGYYNSEGNLAGGAFSLLDAVKNAQEVFEIPLETALWMASGLPASILKTKRKIGKVEVGFEASFITFENNLNNLIFNKY